jgi:hypothetical protein
MPAPALLGPECPDPGTLGLTMLQKGLKPIPVVSASHYVA